MLSRVKKAAKVLDKKYLTANDFNSWTSIKLIDGTKLQYQDSFYLKLSDYVVLFTEHYGIHYFSEEDVISIREFSYYPKNKLEASKIVVLASRN